MSAHILIVDLPDDAKCNCCHAMDEQADRSMWCPLLNREITLSGINWIRPSDCPLIPVDRVMETMESHKVFSLPLEYDDGIDTAVWAMKMALGLEE